MTTFETGAIIGGRYRLDSIIGYGGMTTVYRAFDLRLNRFVALKVLHHYLADSPEFVQRFRRESEVLTKLRHPGIVQIYEVGEADGQLYMALEYVDGGSLADKIRSGPLPIDAAVEIVRQIGSALAYVHKHGIVHRDLKPSNILFARDGRVLLSDLGSGIRPGESPLTQTGTIVGTPVYMSPEQAQGGRLDARSDIFSLGVVLYQLVTGQMPFAANRPRETLLSIVHDPPPPVHKFRPDVSSYLEAVILRALAKDPAERFQTTDEFVAALANLSARPVATAHTRVQMTRPSAKAMPQPMSRRNLNAIGIAAGFVLFGVLLALFMVRVNYQAAPARTPIASATPDATPSRTPFPTSFPLPPTPPPAIGGQPYPALACYALIGLIILLIVMVALTRRFGRTAHEVTQETLAAPFPPSTPAAEVQALDDARLPTSETLPLDPQAERTRVVMRRAPEVAAFLLVLNGPRRGERLLLSRNETSIGRDPARNDICIQDPMLSREHALIRLEGDRFWIYDLGSSNGTFVNGQQALEEELHDRDEIRVGDTHLIFMNIATDISPDARKRLHEFEAMWGELVEAAHHE